MYLLSSSTTSTPLQHMTATHSICSISRGSFCRNVDDKDQKWKRWRRAKSGEKNRPSSDGDLSPTDMHIHLGNEECRKHFTPAFHSTFTPLYSSLHFPFRCCPNVTDARPHAALSVSVIMLACVCSNACILPYCSHTSDLLLWLCSPAISSGLEQLSVDESYRSTKSDIAKWYSVTVQMWELNASDTTEEKEKRCGLSFKAYSEDDRSVI